MHFDEQRLEDIVEALKIAEQTSWNADHIRESSKQYSTAVFKQKMFEIAEEVVASKQ